MTTSGSYNIFTEVSEVFTFNQSIIPTITTLFETFQEYYIFSGKGKAKGNLIAI